MEDRGKARMRKYGESKTTRIMMATVPHVTSGLGLRKNFRPMDFCWHECTLMRGRVGRNAPEQQSPRGGKIDGEKIIFHAFDEF